METNSEEYWNDKHEKEEWDRRNVWAMRHIIENVPQEARVLVVGCAQGMECFELARHRPDLSLILGVDISDISLEKARLALVTLADTHAGEKVWSRIRFEKKDLMKLGNIMTAGSMDYIICIETLEHFHPKRHKFILSSLMHPLKEGGKCFITVPGRNAGDDIEHPKGQFSEQELYDFLSEYSRSIIFYCNRDKDRVICEATKKLK